MKTLSKFLLATLLLIASPLNATTINGPAASSDSFQFGRGANAVNKDLIFNNGAANKPRFRFNMSTSKLQFSHDGVTFADVGSGGGASGADYGQMEKTLLDAELGLNSTVNPNQILDTFNSSLGVVSNLIAQNSSLNFVVGQNSGTYERTRSTSEVMTHINGKAIYRGQQVAPQNTACSPTCSSTAVTFSVFGDVTGVFPSAKNVVISKLSTDDGGNDQIFVMDSSNNVAQLSVTSATYNSGTNLTALVIANPSALDLSLGLSSSNFNSTLRVEPFDFQFQSKTASAGSFETHEIRGIHSRGNIGIPGQSPVNTAILAACSITGSALRVDVTASPNGIYEVARVLEKTASSGNTATYHWAFSINSGVSFTCFATTKAAQDTGNITSGINDEGYFNAFDNFAVLHNDQTIVANNGKAFLGYTKYHNSTDNRTGFAAAYTDLTAGSPSITDTPATTGDGGQANSLSTTPGWVFYRSDTSLSAHCSGDTTDLSFVACICQSQNEVNGDARVRQYTSGGSAYSTTNQPLALAQDILNFGSPKFIDVTGTGVSHRMTVTGNYGGNLSTQYADQAAASFNSRIQQEAGGDIDLIDSAVSGSKQYSFYTNSTNTKISYMSATVSGTPSYSARRDLIKWGGVDKYRGYNSADGKNAQKNSRSHIAIDQGNGNHLFFIDDFVSPGDGIARSTMVEVADDTAFVGSLFSCTSNTSNYTSIRDGTGNQQVGAVFTTVGATKLRTVSMKLRQVGTIPSGFTIVAQLQSATGASPGGSPTGTVLATSVNSYDPSKITKGAGSDGQDQVVFWNFSNVALSATTNYAIVIVANFPVSGSNYLRTQFANPCGTMGTALQYNGSTWGNLGSTSYQLVMDINGEYIYDVSNALNSGVSGTGDNSSDQESSIAFVNSTNGQILSRRVIGQSGAQRLSTGYVTRRTFTVTTSGAISSVGAGTTIGTYDSNLAVNTSLGNSGNSQKDTVTGVVSTTLLGEDRSTYANVATYGAATYGANASFQSGQAANITGSNYAVSYAAQPWMNFSESFPFAIEFEFKPNGVVGSGEFFGTGAAGGTGLYFKANSSGQFDALTRSAGSFVNGSSTNTGFLNTNTYIVIRVIYTGSGPLQIWSASSPTGTFTQATYSSQTTYVHQGSSGVINLGLGSSNPNIFMGYFKAVVGTTTFANTGYTAQPAITDVQNLGSSAFGQSRGGTNGTQNSTFDLASIINTGGNLALVDSYDQDVFMSHDYGLANQGNQIDVKLTEGRGGSTVQPLWMGMIYRLTK